MAMKFGFSHQRMHENRVLMGIFGPKGNEIIESRKKLHNEQLRNLYSCSTHGEKGNIYRILVGKPEGKRPLGRCRRR
jgi:hypothetical protein